MDTRTVTRKLSGVFVLRFRAPLPAEHWQLHHALLMAIKPS
jgi:hypothetical protein